VASAFDAMPAVNRQCTIGVLKGEGIGPEVMDAALTVLAAVESISLNNRFVVTIGGTIGHEAVRECGQVLSPGVHQFCCDVFNAGGAILAGAREEVDSFTTCVASSTCSAS
jgi:isocitrate/isopropylmalate dehydrogenase